MPRDGSGVFSAPAGTTATPNTTVESSKYNAFVADLVSDANAARPVTAGGTGATSKQSAVDNLLDGTTEVTDENLRIVDPADDTKVLVFDVNGITTATTRTLTVPDANGTLLITGANTLSAANQAQARSNISAPLKGHIYGLTLSNNSTDATNDIDIAVGEAASTETNPVLMVLSSGLTKRLDAAWAVGTGNGGLDTGTIANTTYHVWLIRRSDTGVVDALFSASASSPTMPTNYDQKRRIGSILRESGTIVRFVQSGDRFDRAVFSAYSSTSARAAASLALGVPTGISVSPVVQLNIISSTAGSKLLRGEYVSSSSFIFSSVNAASENDYQIVTLNPTTNGTWGSFEVTISAGALSQCQVVTMGWIDTRGR